MVSRREVLALGGSALATGLAGCTSSLPFGGRPGVRVREDPLERNVPASFAGAVPTPLVTLVVGRGTSQTHQVWVWNRTDERRDVDLRIGPADDPWFEASYVLDADGTLAIDLRTAREYEIFVTVRDREKRVRVRKSQFDCNASATDVLVKETETTAQTISTTMGCGGGLF